tara:strand:+ start:242 stop:553 length:312 start_codon:yes stop_codon:yes gene_type:complete
MKKFLFFANSVADVRMLPADDLVLMEIDADGDGLEMHFKSLSGTLGGSTMIPLTITTDSGLDIMRAITEEIAFGEEAMVVIADEINSIFLHGDITAVTNSLTA